MGEGDIIATCCLADGGGRSRLRRAKEMLTRFLDRLAGTRLAEPNNPKEGGKDRTARNKQINYSWAQIERRGVMDAEHGF